MANLQVNSVSKIYPSGTLALYKISLELPDSEFIAVVGGEKSGKSSLLRVIAGIEEATEGQVIIGGVDVTESEPKERDVAMIFQGNSLYPSLNVGDNISYGLRLRHASASVIEQRVKVVAEMLGITDVLYRKPKALTTEQKQKVAFARAVVREPKVYLLDDPLAGLDKALKEKMRNILINLQARMSGTFLYATKNVNEALTMATRVLVLRDGFAQQIDSPANLYDYPANAYVALLIGSPAVNLINKSKIVTEEGKYFVLAGGVKLPIAENILNRFKSIAEYADTEKEIIFGIRPEDILVGADGEIEATVAACEEAGGVKFADCKISDKLSLVAEAGQADKGDGVKLKIDFSRALIFDGETRLTLLERDEGYVPTGHKEIVPLSYAREEELKNKLKLNDKATKRKK